MDKKVIEYKILSFDAFREIGIPEKLERVVNDQLKAGWQLYGDIQVCNNGGRETIYTQVMVKYGVTS